MGKCKAWWDIAAGLGNVRAEIRKSLTQSASAFNRGDVETIFGSYEWHQSFVSLREARVGDVAIDALGAVLAQILVWFYAK